MDELLTKRLRRLLRLTEMLQDYLDELLSGLVKQLQLMSDRESSGPPTRRRRRR